MRSSRSYEAVFSDKTPLQVWPVIARILRRVDEGLESLRSKRRGTDKFLKGWRYIISFALVSESFGKFTYSAGELARFDPESITAEAVERIWSELDGLPRGQPRFTSWPSVKSVCEHLAATKGIKGVEAVPARLSLSDSDLEGGSRPVTDEFVERARQAMPPQPWKPGTHRTVCAQLNCSSASLRAAVERLIADGVFMSQKDGVLYDSNGNVVLVDLDRVDPDTLELLDTP